ncbi:MAG TPA: acylneuraminate cytidylyltransferase [Alphaproteobacteria bacterium]|nr:acylneuraminate cytidylyltransferase [Alphaproteobacteria bacterium]
MNILVVIPARGGSKRIPRKNLRLLGHKPLLYYSINNALKSKFEIDIFVSSEDDEILNTAVKFGAKTHKRNENIANDKTTLDPVIYDCYLHAKNIEEKEYHIIATMQPTSPLLLTKSLDKALQKIINDNEIDTIIAAKDATHLSWKKENDKYLPNYIERVNRQYLTPEFIETGAFLITRNDIISENNRIGKNVDLALLSGGEKIDIDTYEDWNLCEYYLKRKHILFVVTGNNTVGLGHVYNTLLIANDILNHAVTFLLDKESELAFNVIKSKNFHVIIQQNDDIIDDIKLINPDVIINDRLDTSKDYMLQLKKQNYKVVNFEDLGTGCEEADIVINAIYPEKHCLPNHYFGHDYFILRDEFILSELKDVKQDVKNILITFGGVDPNNYTEKVIRTINKYCSENNIKVTVIAGFGYEKYDTIDEYSNVTIKQNISNISDYMLKADLIFTSAGRTVYEVASIGTPAIVMGQNKREMTHFFASSEFGFSNLGLGYEVEDNDLFTEFIRLVDSLESRKHMNELMLKQKLKSGRKIVQRLIQDLIQD